MFCFMKTNEGSCRQYGQELCEQRHERHIQVKGQDSALLALPLSSLGTLGRQELRLWFAKLLLSLNVKI